MSRDNGERSRFAGQGAPRAAPQRIAVVTTDPTLGPNGENCQTCRFKVEIQLPPPNLNKLVVCKKDPPQVVVTGMGTGTTFPPITDWCFAYQAQPAANDEGAAT